uniref:Peptidase_M10 domain-containing protein n=1 Tax=Macrostomum lignano TaxID=282301 RepID=A0A1I8FDD1_9PLAT
MLNSWLTMGHHFGSAITPGKFPLFCHRRLWTVDFSADEVRQMQPAMLWARLAQELAKKFPAAYTRPANHSRRPRSHAELLSCSPGHVNLGAGNLALCGTCGLHFWPTELSGWQTALGSSDSLPADMMDLSASQAGTLGASLSADLGAVLHELLHCLGLGHTRSGVMARGCDLLRLAVAFRQTDETCAACARLSRRPAPKPLYWFGQITCRISALAPPAAAILSHHPWLNCHRLWQTDDNSKIDCDEEGPADRVSISDGHVISVGSSLCLHRNRSLERRSSRLPGAASRSLLGHVGRGGCLQEMRLQSPPDAFAAAPVPVPSCSRLGSTSPRCSRAEGSDSSDAVCQLDGFAGQ